MVSEHFAPSESHTNVPIGRLRDMFEPNNDRSKHDPNLDQVLTQWPGLKRRKQRN